MCLKTCLGLHKLAGNAGFRFWSHIAVIKLSLREKCALWGHYSESRGLGEPRASFAPARLVLALCLRCAICACAALALSWIARLGSISVAR